VSGPLVVGGLGALSGFGALLVVFGARGVGILHVSPRSTRATGSSLALVAGALAAGAACWWWTRWPVLGAWAVVAVLALPSVLRGSGRHHAEIRRVEAIAAWTEQLRDTLAGANGLEHAVAATAKVAPDPLAGEVGRLAARLAYEPLSRSLRAFAAEVDHPTCDFVVAGLVTAAEQEARELSPLLSELSAAARAEAQVRARVWAGRARTRTSVRVIGACVVLFAVGLLLFDRTYLAPYASRGGQLVLVAIGCLFAGALVAMDRMGRIVLPERFVARPGGPS
jgi:Flp pilus assembly protein TadB